MENLKSISFDNIKEYNDYYKNNVVSKVATKAVSKTKISDVCYNTENAKKMNHKFSVSVTTLPATDQKSSGRCWIFSTLNLLRDKVAKELNLGNFEFSQNYISFYDHLEKSNHFLEEVMETADKPLDDRLVSWLFSCPLIQDDGGWWDSAVALCKKYGVVPKEAMPETYQATNTYAMNSIIDAKLREDGLVLRKEIAQKKDISHIRELKNSMLKEIYNILAICLGNPPETFDFEYVDKDNNYHAERNMTPHEFYEKYVGEGLEDIVGVINAPTEDKPFNKLYAVAHSGSVVEGKPITLLNLEVNELKAAAIKQLQNNEAVWFACDSSAFAERKEGIWDMGTFDCETPFSIKLGMTKGEMLETQQSGPAHAMIITGVNLVDGKPDKWRIQNSWGTDGADKGYFIMSDEWFDMFVFQISVNKKYLTEEQREMLNQEPVMINPWDRIAQ